MDMYLPLNMTPLCGDRGYACASKTAPEAEPVGSGSNLSKMLYVSNLTVCDLLLMSLGMML
jgi:hypothetical protein